MPALPVFSIVSLGVARNMNNSSEKVIVVRNPDHMFGGTVSRIKGILATIKTIP
jgi:hypothetical protein